MTVEERLMVGLSEIEAVEVVCRCGTAVTHPAKDWSPSQTSCPGCGQDLWMSGTGELQNLRQLASALRAILRQPAPAEGTQVRLRIAWPPRA